MAILAAGLIAAPFAEPAESAQWAWVHTKGRAVYRDDAGVEQAIPYAYVRMCDFDRDWFGNLECTTMAQGWTDHQGNFDLAGQDWDPSDTPDPYIEVTADNSFSDRPSAKVENASFAGTTAARYCFRTGHIGNIPHESFVGAGSVYDWPDRFGNGNGRAEIVMNDSMRCNDGGFTSVNSSIDHEAGAWHIFRIINASFDWIRQYSLQNPGRNPTWVTVHFPDGDNSKYVPVANRISIAGSQAWDETIIAHEYSHLLHFDFAHPGVVPLDYGGGATPDCQGNMWFLRFLHCLWEPEAHRVHWYEGLPAFMLEAIVDGIGYSSEGGKFTTLHGGGAWCGNRETPAHFWDSVHCASGHIHSSNVHPFGDPEHTEGYTMTVLWDLYDANKDNHDVAVSGDRAQDRVSLSFQDMWNVLVDYDPPGGIFSDHSETLQDYMGGLRQEMPELANRFAELLDENHIVDNARYPAADLRTTSVTHDKLGQTVFPGDRITITDQTTNTGSVTTGPDEVDVAYYLSTDLVVNPGELQWYRPIGELRARGQNGATNTTHLPDIADGDYHLIACADYANYGIVYESSEGGDGTQIQHNCSWTSQVLKLRHPTIAPPRGYTGFSDPAAPPPGWSVNDVGNGARWVFNNPMGRPSGVAEGSFAIADSDYWYRFRGVTSAMATSLHTPSVDISAMDCAEINFDTTMRAARSNAKDELFMVSVLDAADNIWRPVWHRYASDPSFATTPTWEGHVAIDLGKVLAEHTSYPNLQVAFRFEAQDDWYWIIDDFEVKECDRTPPPAPSRPAFWNSESGGPGSGLTLWNNAIYVGTGTPGTQVKLWDSLNGNRLATGTVRQDGGWSLQPLLADGRHALYATVTDDAGNESAPSPALAVTVDTVKPGGSSIPDLAGIADTGRSELDGVTSQRQLTFEGTAEPGVMVELFRHTGPMITSLGTTRADIGTGSWRLTPGYQFEAGSHGVMASTRDAAGNTTPWTAELPITIDTEGPTDAPAPADLVTEDDSGVSAADDRTKVSRPRLTGTGPPGGQVVLTADHDAVFVPVGTADVSGAGTWSLRAPKLAPGVHDVRVSALDAAGNASPLSSVLRLVVDLTAPDTVLEPSGPTGTTTKRSATFRFSSAQSDAASFECKLDGASYAPCDTGSVTYRGLKLRSHTFRVRTVDTVGNRDASPASRTWTVSASLPPRLAVGIGLFR